jgi:hypothetical protein
MLKYYIDEFNLVDNLCVVPYRAKSAKISSEDISNDLKRMRLSSKALKPLRFSPYERNAEKSRAKSELLKRDEMQWNSDIY